MKLPHTITVWNRSDGEAYTRTVLSGVLWEDNRGVQLRKTAASAENGVFVLIPFDVCPPGFSLRPLDFMARGGVPLDPRSAKDLLAAGAVQVTAADRLDAGGLPHWEVTGR
jgi:hypothetical protein